MGQLLHGSSRKGLEEVAIVEEGAFSYVRSSFLFLEDEV